MVLSDQPQHRLGGSTRGASTGSIGDPESGLCLCCVTESPRPVVSAHPGQARQGQECDQQTASNGVPVRHGKHYHRPADDKRSAPNREHEQQAAD